MSLRIEKELLKVQHLFRTSAISPSCTTRCNSLEAYKAKKSNPSPFDKPEGLSETAFYKKQSFIHASVSISKFAQGSLNASNENYVSIH